MNDNKLNSLDSSFPIGTFFTNSVKLNPSMDK